MSRITQSLAGLVLAATALLFASPAFATLIRPQSIETMTLRATAVVRADPVPGSMNSFINPDGVIFTTIEFQVVEVLSGSTGPVSMITVQVPGGIVGDEAMTIDQNAEFLENQQVILFLTRQSSIDPFTVMDLSAGKFEVNIDPDTAQVLLTRNDFGEVDEGQLRGEARDLNIPRDLDDMRAQVLAADQKKKDMIQRGIDPKSAIAREAGTVRVFKQGGAK